MKKTAKNKKKRRTQFPVAAAYFLTLLICLGIFGGLGYYVVNRFVLSDEDKLSQKNALSDIPTSDDRYTVLYVQVDDFNEMNHAMLVRILPDTCQVRIVPVSPYLMSSEYAGDALQTLTSIYTNKGVNGVKKAVENVMGVSVDKYMTVTNASLDNIVGYIGGVTIAPDEDIYYTDEVTGEQIYCKKGVSMSLDHSYLRLYINYPLFSDGPQENVKVMHDVMTRFINEMFLQTDNLSNNMDTFFNIIYNNSDTDMSKNDFIKNKKGIEYIINNGEMPCESLLPVGTWENGTFVVSSSYPERLKTFFDGN